MIIIKTEEEIRLIRASCAIAARVLEKLAAVVRPGIRTIDIDRLAEQMILANGASPAFKGYRGYKHTTCLSVNEEVVHGIPSNRELKEGDIIGIDIGALKDGYYGDCAMTVAIEPVSRAAAKIIRATRECLEIGISKVRQGAHLGDIGEAIESHAKKSGFSVVRDLFGHGVGKSLHEDPLIPNFGEKGTGPELKAGMVLAIEPMLNQGTSDIETLSDKWTVVTADKKLSAHFEHTIVVTAGGCEILTRA